MKKTVFWGIGIICNSYMENYHHLEPDYYIDSNYYGEKFYDKEVVSPQSISDWNSLYVVIMCKHNTEIMQFLQNKGLVHGKDFITYSELAGRRYCSCEDTLSECRELVQRKDYTNITLMFVPAFNMRRSKDMVNFLKQYQDTHKDENCLLLVSGNGLGAVNKSNDIFEIIELPLLGEWTDSNEYYDALDEEYSSKIQHNIDLEEIRDRKVFIDGERTEKWLDLAYAFYRNLFSILRPKRIIIWSAWQYMNYVINLVAMECMIPIGFMEFGWLPGTYQIDHMGIQGQGEYAIEPQRLLQIEVTDIEMENAKKVKDYVAKTKKDSGTFRSTQHDADEIGKIDFNKPLVFVAGTGDKEMGINPESDYWHKYVSHCFKSSIDMLIYIDEICYKNDWNLIFKPHPHCRELDVLSDIKLLSNIAVVLDQDIDSLIEMSDVVVCMASAVEYKVLIYEKALVSVGRSAIQGKKSSYEVDSREQIEEVLRNAIYNGLDNEKKMYFEKHIAQLLKTCLWDDLSEREFRYGLPISHDFFE